jgi:hypothetical protein
VASKIDLGTFLQVLYISDEVSKKAIPKRIQLLIEENSIVLGVWTSPTSILKQYKNTLAFIVT